MGIRFEFLKAGNGDCILISTSNGTNILIDGGLTDTYREIKKHLREMKKIEIKLTNYGLTLLKAFLLKKRVMEILVQVKESCLKH